MGSPVGKGKPRPPPSWADGRPAGEARHAGSQGPDEAVCQGALDAEARGGRAGRGRAGKRRRGGILGAHAPPAPSQAAFATVKMDMAAMNTLYVRAAPGGRGLARVR